MLAEAPAACPLGPETARRFAGSPSIPSPTPTASTRVPSALSAFAEKIACSVSTNRVKLPGPVAGEPEKVARPSVTTMARSKRWPFCATWWMPRSQLVPPCWLAGRCTPLTYELIAATPAASETEVSGSGAFADADVAGAFDAKVCTANLTGYPSSAVTSPLSS